MHGGAGASVSIPLTITVSLGEVLPAARPRLRRPGASNGYGNGHGHGDGHDGDPGNGHGHGDGDGALDGDELAPEAVAADYRDRAGYRPDFLGAAGALVALPQVVRDAGDVLVFGDGETELKYEHFSVVMSASRRLCRFSACNIDGAASRRTTRSGWRRDPRIPERAQILDECYGNPPRFSRGHMTRREDPAWGPPATAQRGSADSMHVTNTAPQLQAFNSPIWLALEDHALQHARQDAMRISVITGPYLEDDDPVLYRVRCPVTFWKVIAFIHDRTGALCATGYEMSQQGNLDERDQEFVFGQFFSPQQNITTQVPIRSIEMRSGIDLGPLVAADPLSGEESLGDGHGRRLDRVEQIRFV
jgi:endonuclease G, mitochondrial